MKSFGKVWLGIGLISIGFGIIILIIVAGTGGFHRYQETYSMQESYDNVKSIDLDINQGRVFFELGDDFSIQASNLLEDGIESYVSDGTWFVQEDYDSDVDLFGFHFDSRNLLYWNDDIAPKIIITVPKDFIADNIKLDIGAGYVEADFIQAKEGSFSLDAGELNIEQIIIGKESSYHVGTGEMTLKHAELKNTTMDTGIGYIMIEGTLLGNNDIACDAGQVEMNLTGEEEDYSYEISTNLGGINIDGESYHNISNEIRNNNQAENNLVLDCGIGNITIEFQ